MYVEIVERGKELKPLVQQVWTFAEGADDKATVFTFPPHRLERGWPTPADASVGLWAAPERFPRIDLDRMIPMGVAEFRSGSDGSFMLSTPQPLVFHRGEARTVNLTVQGGDSVTWSQEIRGAGGDVINSVNYSLPLVDEFTPVTIAPDGLVTIDMYVGRGGELEAGDTAIVGYSFFGADGKLVDSTSLPGRTAEFLQPAPGNKFEGFSRGVLGMRGGMTPGADGERHVRRLVVPPSLAFGSRGAPPLIGPDETLIVDLELHTFKDNTR